MAHSSSRSRELNRPEVAEWRPEWQCCCAFASLVPWLELVAENAVVTRTSAKPLVAQALTEAEWLWKDVPLLCHAGPVSADYHGFMHGKQGCKACQLVGTLACTVAGWHSRLYR